MCIRDRTLATGLKKLENPKNPFFAKMAAKTTSGSDFDFGFVFYAPDLVGYESNLEKFAGALFEIFGVKLEKFKNYLKKLREFPIRKFLIFCGLCGHLARSQNISTSVE